MVDLAKIVKEERVKRLEQRLVWITRCCDEIEAIKKYPPNALLNTLGQCDWLFELHNLLYDEYYQFAPSESVLHGVVVNNAKPKVEPVLTYDALVKAFAYYERWRPKFAYVAVEDVSTDTPVLLGKDNPFFGGF